MAFGNSGGDPHHRAYEPLTDTEQADPEGFKSDIAENGPLGPTQNRGARRARRWILSGVLILVCCAILYSIIPTAVTTPILCPAGGQSTVSSNVYVDAYQKKVGDFIEYEPRVFNQDDDDSQFFGEPSEVIDRNWHELFEPQNMGLPAEYMRGIGRLEEGIPIHTGDYYGSFMVFHHLHCLKYLYHNLHPEYYGLVNLTRREKDVQTMHLEHCLNMLRQAIMCQADTTLVTMKWDDHNTRPIGNLDTPHRCIRWDRFLEFVEPRSFDGLKENFVHPKFGDPYAGKSELDLMLDRNSTMDEGNAHN